MTAQKLDEMLEKEELMPFAEARVNTGSLVQKCNRRKDMTYEQFREKFGDDKRVEQLGKFISIVEGIKKTFDCAPDGYYNPDYYKARGVPKRLLNELKKAHFISWEKDSSISIHFDNYSHPECTYKRLLDYNYKLGREKRIREEEQAYFRLLNEDSMFEVNYNIHCVVRISRDGDMFHIQPVHVTSEGRSILWLFGMDENWNVRVDRGLRIFFSNNKWKEITKEQRQAK